MINPNQQKFNDSDGSNYKRPFKNLSLLFQKKNTNAIVFERSYLRDFAGLSKGTARDASTVQYVVSWYRYRPRHKKVLGSNVQIMFLRLLNGETFLNFHTNETKTLENEESNHHDSVLFSCARSAHFICFPLARFGCLSVFNFYWWNHSPLVFHACGGTRLSELRSRGIKYRITILCWEKKQ